MYEIYLDDNLVDEMQIDEAFRYILDYINACRTFACEIKKVELYDHNVDVDYFGYEIEWPYPDNSTQYLLVCKQ